MARHRLARVAGTLLLVACRRDGGAGDVAGDTLVPIDPESTTGDTDTGTAWVPSGAADVCALAASSSPGTQRDTLRGRSSTLGGACNQGGPEAFFAVEVPRRSDVFVEARGTSFEPVVGLLSSCTAGWTEPQLLCTRGVGGWLLDVAAGSPLYVAVGIDPEHPALQTLATDAFDALGFELDIRLRDVLLPGELCEPASRGRCVGGTACLAGQSAGTGTGTGDGAARCVEIWGDTCANASILPVGASESSVVVDPSLPFGDAHAHGCGGARRAEQVVRLELPPPSASPRNLVVWTDTPEIGLALRGPSCVADDELGCGFGGADTVLTVTDIDAANGGSTTLWLFIELADPTSRSDTDGSVIDTDGSATSAGEEAPFEVRVRLDPG